MKLSASKAKKTSPKKRPSNNPKGKPRDTQEKVVAKFWGHVTRKGPYFSGQDNHCWIWSGPAKPNGYGSFQTSYFGGHTCPHTLAKAMSESCFVSKTGHVMHLCANKLCVRPEHLWVKDVTKPESYFWRMVDKKDGPTLPGMKTRCWEWQGRRVRGYGMFSLWRPSKGDQRGVKASRAVMLMKNPDLPDTVVVCHKCDNPACVRPSHLFLGTANDNVQDKVAKGRQAKGVSCAKAKLSEAKVLAIRSKKRLEGVSNATLAEMYGVTKTTIFCILKRRTWRHILCLLSEKGAFEKQAS